MNYDLGYLPHIEGAWNQYTVYTPMSIVTNHGKTYISKVAVGEGAYEPGVSAGWEGYWQLLAEGIQGYTGTGGAQGYTGVQGAQGANGYQGSDGVQGIQGYQGIQGNTGAQGTAPANTETFTFEMVGGTTVTKTFYIVP